jgi:hypothetical protein
LEDRILEELLVAGLEVEAAGGSLAAVVEGP